MILADARHLPIASGTVQCGVTSPPYFGLRDYGISGQIGLEESPDGYISALAEAFREVWRVLRDDGVLWLNLGDSYAGSWGAQSRGNTAGEASSRLEGSSMLDARRIVAHPLGTSGTGSLKRTPGLKNKDLIGIPWRVALALQADGWWLRSDVIWSKPNCMPESVTDRPTRSHEYVFLLTKSERYYWNQASAKERAIHGEPFHGGYAAGGRSQARNGRETARAVVATRNLRSVWTISPQPYHGAHFAVMPEALARRCILAGSRPGDLVLDPFGGTGTVARVATSLGRRGVMCDLNRAYLNLARERLQVTRGLPLEMEASA